MRPSFALLLLLTACEGGVLVDDDTGVTDTDDANTDGDTDDTSGDGPEDTDEPSTGCTATLSSVTPAAGEEDVSVTKVITAWFSAPVEAGEWSIVVPYVAGSSSLAADGKSATFTSDAAYQTETAYTATVTVCDQTTSVPFTTAGGPIESDLDGRTYAIDFDDVTIVEPAAAAAFAGNLDVEWILFHVVDDDSVAGTIEVAGSLGVDDPPVQDPCTTPYAFDPADFSGNPVFEVGPADLTIDAGDQGATVYSAHVKAVFVEDGAAIEDILISGQIDLADFGAEAYGCLVAACVPCDHDASITTCTDAVLVADRGNHQPGLVFDPLLDPSQNASCN